jgi:hypothetical protein
MRSPRTFSVTAYNLSKSPPISGTSRLLCSASKQGLTLVHVRAQLEQLQDTFMNEVKLNGGQKSSC